MPYDISPMSMEYLQDLDYESVVQPATRVYFPLQATFAESESIFSSPMPSLFQPRPSVSAFFSGGSWARPSMMDMEPFLMDDPAMQIVKKRRHQSKLNDGEATFASPTQKPVEDNLLKPDFTPDSPARRSYTKNRTSFIEIKAFQVPGSPISRPASSSSSTSTEREVPIPHTPEPELPEDISPEFSSFSSLSSGGTFSSVGDLDDLDDMPPLEPYSFDHIDECPINCPHGNEWNNMTWDNSPPTKNNQFSIDFLSMNKGFKVEPKIYSPGYTDVENMELCSI